MPTRRIRAGRTKASTAGDTSIKNARAPSLCIRKAGTRSRPRRRGRRSRAEKEQELNTNDDDDEDVPPPPQSEDSDSYSDSESESESESEDETESESEYMVSTPKHGTSRGKATKDKEDADIPIEAAILSLGLQQVGFSSKRQQSVRSELNGQRFKAHFGVGPKTIRSLAKDVKRGFPSFDIKYLLLSLNWLKIYDTEHTLSARWDFCEEHIREKVKEYSNSSGLKYEFAVALRRAKIVSIRGPVPAGQMHDGTMFRGGTKQDKEKDMDALYYKLPAGKKAIGDSGYDGMPEKVIVTREGHSKELKQFLGRAKNRQESLHTRLKSFRALGCRFRHGKGAKRRMELHKACVEAVCVIVQYDMECGNPIFDL
ncbi:hypothetical protein ACHAWF_013824 [Thalassiosira exigua]